MICLGADLLDRLAAGDINEAKMVFNECGAIVFPASVQHRDMKAEGISYEDDHAGNALAAMLRRDAVEIRFHRSFDDKAVDRLVRRLISLPSLSRLAQTHVTYQGRVIVI